MQLQLLSTTYLAALFAVVVTVLSTSFTNLFLRNRRPDTVLQSDRRHASELYSPIALNYMRGVHPIAH